jgi:hypothetical protein
MFQRENYANPFQRPNIHTNPNISLIPTPTMKFTVFALVAAAVVSPILSQTTKVSYVLSVVCLPNRNALCQLTFAPRHTQTTTRGLTECDTLKACYLHNWSTGQETRLVPGEGRNAYPISSTLAPRGYTIRCAVNGKDELDYIKFIYNGTVHDEFREPRWMSSASAVSYLSTCGPKTVRVQGHVWSKLCFETQYDLTAQCDGEPRSPATPMAPPVVAPVATAPVMAPKAAPAPPPKAVDSPAAPPKAAAPVDSPKAVAPVDSPKATTPVYAPPRAPPIDAPKASPVGASPMAAPSTPVIPPVVAPMLPPMASPPVVAAPMAMPVGAPIAAPVVAPVAPVAAPAAPVSPPTKGDSPIASPSAPVPIAPVAQPVAPAMAPKAPSLLSPTAPVASPTKCPPGYKLVSGYCVVESCKCDFKCPANAERIPNRKCYESIKDCACQKGYTRRKFGRHVMCRKTVICAHGMTWWGSCKSAPK